MIVYLDGDSIGEILETQQKLKMGGYEGEIKVILNPVIEEFIKKYELEINNKSVSGIKEIFSMKVVPFKTING